MALGGKRPGAGRPSALSDWEKLRAGNLCDAMQRAKAKERGFVLLYGEDAAQEILAANAALEAARDAFLALSPQARVAQRAAYNAWKRRLQARLQKTLATSARDTSGKERRGVEVGGAQGRPSRRLGQDEKTRSEIIDAVAERLSEELGFAVSTAAVRKAWEFQRRFNAPDAITLQKKVAKAVDKAQKKREKSELNSV